MGHDDNTYGTIEVIAGPMFAGKSEERGGAACRGSEAAGDRFRKER